MVDLRGAQERGIGDDVPLPVQAGMSERELGELAHRVRLAGGDDVVGRLVLLQHQPHRLDVVAREPPVTLRLHVAEPQLLREPELDPSHPVADLAGDKFQSSTRTLVVKKYS